MVYNVFAVHRIEGKGKGILQHHQIILEFEAIPAENQKKLADGAFYEILKATQVKQSQISLLFFSFGDFYQEKLFIFG